MHTQSLMPQSRTRESSTRKLGSILPSTTILPWYEEADFADLSAIAGRGSQDYQTWYRNVMQAVDELLREGKSIKFVTVRPAAYCAWLREGPNTPESRLGYAKYLATASEAAAA
ncbi:hypothetical protein WBO78_24325 [Bosea sp. CCNWLW174]|uniref:hypothetical protein n=1 Tax=unclassified Bosea (in: a-proteobacteria) TaxID=2653178 RepID=UPI0030144524